MPSGTHGSRERMPGALFRAMGTLFLQKNDGSREALAREFKQHLATCVANTARRMGYASSCDATQPILGGHKKRTRG